MAWRSCSVLCRLVGGDPFRCSVRGGRWPGSLQQRCSFRKAARKPEQKKPEDPVPARPSPPEPVVQNRPPTEPPLSTPRDFRRLVRPMLFTVGFTGCSFGSAAIWQYESVKSRVQGYFDELRADWLERVRRQKRGDSRNEINQWWNSLTEGQRMVIGIIAANVLVFCCWKVPALQLVMIRYFTSNPTSKALCFPMLLSTFSHFSFFHLAANMYVLWSFSSSAVSMLGREQFMAVYLSAGVFSTLVSYVCKTATGIFTPSLGASGAIMTVLAAVCTKMPEAKLAIVFLPMFTFTAGNALKAIVAMDTAGLVLGWNLLDHGAHLGGALFGIWYVLFGHELIWENREPFVKLWHELRRRSGPGGAA